MKKFIKISSIIILCIGVIVLGIYIYLNMPRKIKIYGEYKQVYTKRETSGILWLIVFGEDVRKSIIKNMKVEVPDIDFNKYYLLYSDGRKIKEINYTVGSQYKWCFDVMKGVEVAEKKHYPHTAFFYLIEKVIVKQEAD